MYFGNNSNQPTQVVGGSKTKTLLATITSSQNWTCPEGITSIDIFLVGGGAGGNSGGCGFSDNNKHTCGGAGGSGGECVFVQNIETVPNQQYSVTIGIGGSGGIGLNQGTDYNQNNGNAGQAGGDSSFGNLYTAKGGLAGYNNGQMYTANSLGNGGYGGFNSDGGYIGGNILNPLALNFHPEESDAQGYTSFEWRSMSRYALVNPYNNTIYGCGGSGGGNLYGSGSSNIEAPQGMEFIIYNTTIAEGGSVFGDGKDATQYGCGGGGGGCGHGGINKAPDGGNGKSGVCFIYG